MPSKAFFSEGGRETKVLYELIVGGMRVSGYFWGQRKGYIGAVGDERGGIARGSGQGDG